MSFLKTNTVDITVDSTSYNSLSDLGLAIENTNCIGTPVQDESNLVWVPGRSGPLDLTDTVFGEQYFQYRPINIKFGALQDTEDWDSYITYIRNLFEGKIVKLCFQTESPWYWTGRARIEEFEHKRQLGTFRLTIPFADPYKYQDTTVSVTASSSGTTVVCENSRMKVYPTITTTDTISVVFGDTTVSLSAGTHTNTAILFEEGDNTLVITGDATVTIAYTQGSL